jgi:hypothetical protein
MSYLGPGNFSWRNGWYASRHFAVNTDVSKLLSPDLAWRKREMEFKTAFPELAEAIIAVVEAPTPELSGAAADTLAGRLKGQDDGFRSVQQAGGGDFFARSQLLYLPADECCAGSCRRCHSASKARNPVATRSTISRARLIWRPIPSMLSSRIGPRASPGRCW